jgi:hypothetical protein
MFGCVGQRLGDGEVGGDLHLLGQPSRHVYVQGDRDGRPAGQRSQRRGQAAFGENRRVDAMGELAQLVARLVRLRGQGVQPRDELAGCGRDGSLRQARL